MQSRSIDAQKKSFPNRKPTHLHPAFAFRKEAGHGYPVSVGADACLVKTDKFQAIDRPLIQPAPCRRQGAAFETLEQLEKLSEDSDWAALHVSGKSQEQTEE